MKIILVIAALLMKINCPHYLTSKVYIDNIFSDNKMSVTLHTTVGDMKLELFAESCPKTVENFLALAGTDYYNGCIFIRNIKVSKFYRRLKNK